MDVDISRIVMYVIAATLVLCSAGVILYHGSVDGMPYGWVGLGGAVIFTLVALGFTRIRHDAH
jgi:hypothetical protein